MFQMTYLAGFTPEEIESFEKLREIIVWAAFGAGLVLLLLCIYVFPRIAVAIYKILNKTKSPQPRINRIFRYLFVFHFLLVAAYIYTRTVSELEPLPIFITIWFVSIIYTYIRIRK